MSINKKKANNYDAIVIGTGISGGWAAKELTEGGLKTLVLERGRMVKHVIDYPTMLKNPWELPYGDELTAKEREDYHVQNRTGYTMKQSTKHWFVNDKDQPYTEKKFFAWIRGYHVGGKSLMWARQSYRYSDFDFEANAKDGLGVDWPIRYKDMKKWYDYVESFAGISGSIEGIPQLPDGNFLPPMEMNCVETHVSNIVKKTFSNRHLIIGRTANLTRPHNGRGKCQHRNLCIRGCPYGGYFSSNASTLPAAEKTGNMTLMTDSIVQSIIYDKEKGKAVGVRVKNAHTLKETEYFAKIIFVNASTINSTYILLNSVSDRFPDGLGNDSGELGCNLMDHVYGAGAIGTAIEGFDDKYYIGRRPNGVYMPKFRNIGKDKAPFLRSYVLAGGAGRDGWGRGASELAVGPEIKELVMEPGPWRMSLSCQGEMLPRHENKMYLNHNLKDKWDMPTVVFDGEFGTNEKDMRKDVMNTAAEILEASGFKDIKPYNRKENYGLGIHELGTARMGKDPKTSVLNKYNQIHACKNVFVTDGSCMASSGTENPSLTYMALTARACHYALGELKKGNL